MSDQPLDQMRAERDLLNARIAAAEAENATTYNSRLDDVERALEEHADAKGWTVTRGRRKNATMMDIASSGLSVSAHFYYDEGDYPAGGTALTVTEKVGKVTASFDGVPKPFTVAQLVEAWLSAQPTTEQ